MIARALRSADLWTGLALLALALGALFSAGDIRVSEEGLVGPRRVPQIVASLLALCGAALAVRGVWSAQRMASPPPQSPSEGTGIGLLVALLAVGAGWIVALPEVGYLLATAGALLAALIILRMRLGSALAVAVVGALALQLLFVELLGVWMPTGRLVDAAALLGL